MAAVAPAVAPAVASSTHWGLDGGRPTGTLTILDCREELKRRGLIHVAVGGKIVTQQSVKKKADLQEAVRLNAAVPCTVPCALASESISAEDDLKSSMRIRPENVAEFRARCMELLGYLPTAENLHANNAPPRGAYPRGRARCAMRKKSNMPGLALVCGPQADVFDLRAQNAPPRGAYARALAAYSMRIWRARLPLPCALHCFLLAMAFDSAKTLVSCPEPTFWHFATKVESLRSSRSTPSCSRRWR